MHEIVSGTPTILLNKVALLSSESTHVLASDPLKFKACYVTILREMSKVLFALMGLHSNPDDSSR